MATTKTRQKASSPKVTKASSPAERELERGLKKIATGRATEGTIGALMEAAALLALGGYFAESLRLLRQLASSSKRVIRLVYEDGDATPILENFHALAAVTASPSLKKELAVPERDLAHATEERKTQFASQRAYFLENPDSQHGVSEEATLRVREMAALLAKGRPRAALELGRQLVACPADHWTAELEQLLLTAQVAFDADERAEALQLVSRAAELSREAYDQRWDELTVLLSFEPSALALARGDLTALTLERGLVDRLVSAAFELLEKLGAAAEASIEWPKLLKKLAGARALRPGAAEAEIAALEARLKTKLPEQYRVLLGTSNGLGKSKRSLRLLPAAEVQWFRDSNAEWMAAYEQEGALIEHWESTLQISGIEDGEVYLLNPCVRTRSGEWEAWHFANFHPGEHRFDSLGQLLESLAEG